MGILTRNQSRVTLLAPTSLPVAGAFLVGSVTSITQLGVTATATRTGHGMTNGSWVMMLGANHPFFNGPFQIANVTANTFDYTMEGNPGGAASGTITSYQVLPPANLWGDGTTPAGSLASLGSLKTSEGGSVIVRMATTTAPLQAPRASIYTSPAGLPGTWRAHQEVDGTIAANDQSTIKIFVGEGSFALVVFWRATGTAVLCDAVADESTSHTYV